MKQLIRDYMSTDLETLSPDTSLDQAVQLEARRHIRHIPIVDNGHLVGIVTDRDLKRAMPSLLTGTSRAEYDRVMKSTTLSQIMTRSPSTIAPSATLASAVRLLVEKKIGALPVVADHQLVGILTETDVLKAFLERLDAEAGSTPQG